jgi:glycosyltransferase involved in cell wall biosynthesis
LVVIEAFRQRTPVIARNLGGTPEILTESGGGIAYDTQDQLVAAMDHLLAEPSERIALGMSGYAAFQTRWTPEAYLKQYFELIEGIAARKAGVDRAPRTAR